MVVGNSLQAIYGTRSENLKGDIEALIASGGKSLAAPPAGATPIEPVAATYSPLPAEQVEKIHQALGGRDNLLEVQAVAHTRLRIRLRQLDRLNEASLYHLGVRAVHPVGEDVVHLVVGQESSRWSQSLEVK
jgi:PTS system glucose-specific IIC component